MKNWSDLKVFLALVRDGTLAKAARRLNVDQTTVRRRVAALEDELATLLFDRTPTGYALTDSGRRLMPIAEAMEAQALMIERALTGADLVVQGVVRLATPEAFGAEVIARHLHLLAEHAPGIRLELVAETRHFSLTKREADIAIGLARPTTGRATVQKLTDYLLQLYAAPSYLARKRPIATLEDLKQHHSIWYIDDLLHYAELKELEAFFNSDIVFRSTSVQAQAIACAEGVGLALLPHFLAAHRDDLVPVLPGLAVVTRTLWMSVHADLRNLPRIRAVVDFLKAVVVSHQDVLLGGHARPKTDVRAAYAGE